MSNVSEFGVLYIDHTDLSNGTPVASLWSFESRVRERQQRPVVVNSYGNREYWLERSDPLLNTILPGTGVSLIVNFAHMWAAGRSLATSALLPPACVVGPVTQSRILRMAKTVHAVGAVVPTSMTADAFGVPASELVDQIVPLQDLWAHDDVDRLLASLACLKIPHCLSALRGQLMARIGRPGTRETAADAALRLIRRRAGRISIDQTARSHGLTRQQFTRQFSGVAGLPPKLFSRITRFQALVHVLLSTDVSEWASLSSALGFYDQAHMINEFRAFAGSPPTVFFQPHGEAIDRTHVQLRGRPSEWLSRPEPTQEHTPVGG